MPPAPLVWVMLMPATPTPALLPPAGPRVITLGWVAGTSPLLTPAFRELLDYPDALSLISAPDRSDNRAFPDDLRSPSSAGPLVDAFSVGLYY